MNRKESELEEGVLLADAPLLLELLQGLNYLNSFLQRVDADLLSASTRPNQFASLSNVHHLSLDLYLHPPETRCNGHDSKSVRRCGWFCADSSISFVTSFYAGRSAEFVVHRFFPHHHSYDDVAFQAVA